MKNKKKGEMDMTETIENVAEILDTYGVKQEQKKDRPKLNAIITFIKLKEIANNNNNLIERNIEKNKNIRNGQVVIKGTRITPNELILIIDEVFDNKTLKTENALEYIQKEYPSIDSEEKIVAGIMYSIKKFSTLKYILGEIFVGN